MFKFAAKLIILTTVLTGTGLFVASGEASAACPDSRWGVNTGTHGDGFAGLIVRAETNTGQSLNNGVRYNLRSALPGPRSAYDEHVPANVADHHARIFNYPTGDNQGRSASRWSDMGEPIYNGRGTSDPNSSYSCAGWSITGPGYPDHQGNRKVLDCNERRDDGGEDAVRFWVSDVTTPNGYPDGGNWQVRVKSQDTGWNWQTRTNNIDNSGMGFITLENGTSAYIELIWHPNPPTGGNQNSRCEQVSLTTGSGQRGYVRVTDSRGNVLVQGADGPFAVMGQSQTRTWDYKARGHSITVQTIRKEKDAAGNWTVEVHNETNNYNCYNVSCTMEIIGNISGHSNGVESFSPFAVKTRIYNNAHVYTNSPDVLYSGIDGAGLIFTTTSAPGGVGFWATPGQISKGNYRQFIFPLNEPGLAINNYNIEAKVFYNFDPNGGFQGGDWELANCNTSFSVYKEFKLEPQANSMTFYYNGTPDTEDPNRVVLAGNINNDIEDYREARMTAQADGIFEKNGSHYSTHSKTYNNLGSSPVDFEASVSNPRLGDEYCGSIRLSPYWGWQGPSNRVDIIGSKTVGRPCTEIVNRPYTRVYGADVTAGSSFVGEDEECNANSRQIRSYTSTHNDKSGSGAQLAAIAMNTIESFRTASLRTSPNPPTAPNGLSFGNDSSPVGHYSGEPLCSTDFYNDTQSDIPDKKNTISSGVINLSSAASYHASHDQTLVSNPARQLTLNGANNFNDKKIIYVDGDVTITSDIRYVNFADASDAPAFMLVASGNIFIERGVNRLDGIYVAQQNPDGNGGAIFTCAKPGQFATYNDNEMFDNCGGPGGEGVGGQPVRQLTVNGAFIANDIKLHRVHKSVRDSRSDTQETANATEASEIFNFSPEMYLSPPPFSTHSSATSRFQFYTTLPPVL